MTPTEGTSTQGQKYLPDLGLSRPSTARVYNAILGGKDNFEIDRQAADVFLANLPQAREIAWENRDALIRGVEYLTGTVGIDQFLDIGCGLPITPNTHEAALGLNPAARVAYVDNDPIVLAHGRALLATGHSSTVTTADLREPQHILDHPDITSFLDFDRPVAVILVGILMHISDAEQPGRLLRELMDAMCPGSYVFTTQWPDTGDPAQAALSRACLETLGTGWKRPLDTIRGQFDGLELLPPGLEYIARWHPEDPAAPVPAVEDLQPYQRAMMVALARKNA
ncbi:SAM-dependent methyltransferase [Nocardiopsis gilva YIM 90087]|uniref:SAM-dependent methyltransferase n=1 Tax=Nocardiopsis gilva YIM 90087 TaxID=1235441 RepID=A0A223S735_9ACTN|nr:SAM-dependent methyltransferase [Nocardiopsis gilva]ASU83869.1 SAM-dependent methyltransferase [Nocardiopsis gilva YIM 90087]